MSVEIAGFEDVNNVIFKIINLMGQTIYQELLINKSHTELNLSRKLNESVKSLFLESGNAKVLKKCRELVLNKNQ